MTTEQPVFSFVQDNIVHDQITDPLQYESPFNQDYPAFISAPINTPQSNFGFYIAVRFSGLYRRPQYEKKYKENRFVVKHENQVKTYYLNEDACYRDIFPSLLIKIIGDFYLNSVNQTWKLVPNCSENTSLLHINDFLNQLHISPTNLETRNSWWLVAKTGGYFYLQSTEVVSAMPSTPSSIATTESGITDITDISDNSYTMNQQNENIFTCSVCFTTSTNNNNYYTCNHHLCTGCYNNWSNTRVIYRNRDRCPECRQPSRVGSLRHS